MVSFPRIGAAALAAFAFQPIAAAPSPLPAPIAKELGEMAAQCLEATGQRGSAGQAISRADLDGDGLDDYIFQPSVYDCPGAASLFAGTAATGDPLSVYIADRAGGAWRVWSDGVGEW